MKNPSYRSPLRKGVFILPNLLTTASLFSGFYGMILALEGHVEWAAIAIFVSALMDGMDGKVARLTNTASEFGIQYDSLCDLVAFGVAPAMMMWTWQLQPYGRLGVGVAFLFAACGALRLARFNVSTATTCKAFFTGLPIPAAGCTLASLVLVSPYVQPEFSHIFRGFSLFIVICLAFLMVSRVRYLAFKEFGFVRSHPFRTMVTIILLFVLITTEPRMLSFLIFMGYIVSGLAYSFIILPRRNRQLLRSLS